MEFKATKPIYGLPSKNGLYDPQFEKDSCGVGLVANINGNPSREIIGIPFKVLPIFILTLVEIPVPVVIA